MSEQEIEALQGKIEALRKRIPPHSIPPRMLEELESLEEQLQQLKESAP